MEIISICYLFVLKLGESHCKGLSPFFLRHCILCTAAERLLFIG
jgi:hypothetical protein